MRIAQGITSHEELAVVKHALDLVSRTQARFAPLMRSVNWHPIPFFGSLASARILTFGLNPSSGEFAVGRSWPAQLSAEGLAERLVRYFSAQGTGHHRWFKAWSDSISVLGASYQRDAAHIDLSPRPTASARTFSRDPQKSLFVEMLRTDAPIWINAINAAPKLELILLAGSASNQYYINEFIQTELAERHVTLLPPWRRGSGEGQTTFQDLVLPGGRTIPVFFCSSGPAKPAVLVNAVSANAQRLAKVLTRE
jgi:hypothetical protein